MKKNIFLILFAYLPLLMMGQGIGINPIGAAPAGDAGLDVNFTDKGLLIPRVSLTNTGTYGLAGGGPTTSMLVYNTNNSIAGTGAAGTGFYFWNGSRWEKLLDYGTPADAWLTTGNAGTTAGTHFIGTTDNISLVFKTNNLERMRILNSGWIGVGTATPSHFLHITPPSINNFDVEIDVNNATDAALRVQHLPTNNGSRVVFGITNYNGSSFWTPGVMGLSLNTTTTGSGGIGVQASANNESGMALYATLYYSGGYSGWAGYFNADVYCGGTYFGSDIRLKKNVRPINSATNIIKQLNPVIFNYDIEKYPYAGFEERERFGFIAQEIEKILPNIVKEKNIVLNSNKKQSIDLKSEDAEMEVFKVVDYVSLIPILTQAIKEQQQQIEDLKMEIEKLKNK